MSRTFGAVHVKGSRGALIGEWMMRRLVSEGFERVEDSQPENDGERRVVVFDDAGWVVLADEDQLSSERGGEVLAREVSAAFDADAIAISVFREDATLVRCHSGKRVGGIDLPGGKREPASGHRYADAAFLVDLAKSNDARRELERGLLADHTFSEQTFDHAAQLIALPHPRAGADSLLSAPPVGSIKLRFRKIANPSAPRAVVERRLASEEGRAVIVATDAEIRACVGMPLYEHATVQVQARAGERITGIGVILGGTALDLLDVTELAGWNPDLGAGATTDIVVVPLERRGDHAFAMFPAASLAPSQMLMPAGTSAAELRAWHDALRAQARNDFFFHLRGHPATAGRGELTVTVTDVEGRPLDAELARVAIDVPPGPRLPVVAASPASTDRDSHRQRSSMVAAEAYAGDRWLGGWLAFDASFQDLGAFVLDSAGALAAALARVMGPLQVSITAAGTHPEVDARLGEDDELAAIPIVGMHLADEADVRVHVPYDAICRNLQAADAGAREYDAAFVRVRHQPEGSTVFDRELRATLEAHRASGRIVPLDLFFSIPRPRELAERRTLAALVKRIFEDAATRASCVGGFVAPMGGVLLDRATPYETISGIRTNDEVEVIRTRARSPGWRVILPPAAARGIDVHPSVTRTEAGATLLATAAADPFDMDDAEREAIERSILQAPAT